jgi:hypothetical protein
MQISPRIDPLSTLPTFDGARIRLAYSLPEAFKS